MQTIAYTEARNQLAHLMDEVVQDCEPMTITRNGKGMVVMMAVEAYNAMQATLHLLSTPANAERLRQGLKDYARGKFKARKLVD